MARAPKKRAPAKLPADEIPKAKRERMIAQLKDTQRKLGTHGFFTRLWAVVWINQGRPYPEVAKLVTTLLNRSVTKKTIAGWVRTVDRKGVEKGIDALHDRRSRAATAAYAAGPKIRKLHARGFSTGQIARRLHVGEIWVRRYLAMRSGQPLP
jgi:hypothetical protein